MTVADDLKSVNICNDVAGIIVGYAKPGLADAITDGALSAACRSGNVKAAEYIADEFVLTHEDARNPKKSALVEACMSHSLVMVQWTIKTFGFTKKEIRRTVPGEIAYNVGAARPGTKLAKYLKRKYGP